MKLYQRPIFNFNLRNLLFWICLYVQFIITLTIDRLNFIVVISEESLFSTMINYFQCSKCPKQEPSHIIVNYTPSLTNIDVYCLDCYQKSFDNTENNIELIQVAFGDNEIIFSVYKHFLSPFARVWLQEMLKIINASTKQAQYALKPHQINKVGTINFKQTIEFYEKLDISKTPEKHMQEKKITIQIYQALRKEYIEKSNLIDIKHDCLASQIFFNDNDLLPIQNRGFYNPTNKCYITSILQILNFVIPSKFLVDFETKQYESLFVRDASSELTTILLQSKNPFNKWVNIGSFCDYWEIFVMIDGLKFLESDLEYIFLHCMKFLQKNLCKCNDEFQNLFNLKFISYGIHEFQVSSLIHLPEVPKSLEIAIQKFITKQIYKDDYDHADLKLVPSKFNFLFIVFKNINEELVLDYYNTEVFPNFIAINDVKFEKKGAILYTKDADSKNTKHYFTIFGENLYNSSAPINIRSIISHVNMLLYVFDEDDDKDVNKIVLNNNTNSIYDDDVDYYTDNDVNDVEYYIDNYVDELDDDEEVQYE